MKVESTALPEVLLLTPDIFRDERGAFWETWQHDRFVGLGMPSTWVQDNCSISRRNVVRALHYQVVRPQGKLVRVARGSILDIAVDLRRSSPRFGQSVGLELSAESGQMLYIPIGFGHGFAALADDTTVNYKVTDYYSPEGERTILWNDPDLKIQWPVDSTAAIISAKDQRGRLFREAEVFA